MSSLATSALSKERLAKANAKRNKTQKQSVPPKPVVPPESPFPINFPQKKKNKEKQKSRVSKQIHQISSQNDAINKIMSSQILILKKIK